MTNREPERGGEAPPGAAGAVPGNAREAVAQRKQALFCGFLNPVRSCGKRQVKATGPNFSTLVGVEGWTLIRGM